MADLKIFLLRHGETTFNADGNRYCGRTDAALTDKGKNQAKQLSGMLKKIKFDGVYASPLMRAAETAGMVSPEAEVQTDDRLIEVDFGMWEGKTREEFVAEDPDLWAKWSSAPDDIRAGGTGETAREVVLRVADFFSGIREKHTSGNILVVAHNTVNRLFLCWNLGMELKNYRRIVQENCALTLVNWNDKEGFSLMKLNYRGEYPE
ncbi:histidine phosphatase family protein [Negadavirga shengliensis]|uniref:Histidine phosphatase family protein n=1 Tax=Negadavirga shengliensis TaxID=1389218 RepID=A0ABV9T8C6_9BACT